MGKPLKDRNKYVCVKHDLKKSLGDGWVDVDIAMYYLGVHTGIVEYNEGGFTESKHIFWTNNPTCELLYGTLLNMAKIGIVELDEEAQQVRWKK